MRSLRALGLTRGAGPLTYLSRRYFVGRNGRHARNRRNTLAFAASSERSGWLRTKFTMAMARLGVALHLRHPPLNLKGVAKEATENKPTVFHSNQTSPSSGPRDKCAARTAPGAAEPKVR